MEFSHKRGMEVGEASEAKTKADMEQKLTETVDGMKKQHGDKYDSFVSSAASAVKVFANEAMINTLNTVVLDGVRLGDHPVMIDHFNTLASKISEDTFVSDGSGGKGNERPKMPDGTPMLDFPSMRK